MGVAADWEVLLPSWHHHLCLALVKQLLVLVLLLSLILLVVRRTHLTAATICLGKLNALILHLLLILLLVQLLALSNRAVVCLRTLTLNKI